MRPAILALGVFGTVVGLFLFVTGYRMASIPMYGEVYLLGVGLEISGGITTAMGLAIAVFGAASDQRQEERPVF